MRSRHATTVRRDGRTTAAQAPSRARPPVPPRLPRHGRPPPRLRALARRRALTRPADRPTAPPITPPTGPRRRDRVAAHAPPSRHPRPRA
eukprot:4649447-Prymnesium_polylepis.1